MNTNIISSKLIDQFNTENLVQFFRSNTRTFRQTDFVVSTDKADFTDGLQVGTFTTNDTNEHELAAYCFKVQKPLSERSGKKAQYDLAKRILKQEQRYSAGIFVLYDDKGDFRFSLIYDILSTEGKRSWSNFRRFTYFVGKEQTNKTFIRQMTEADFSALEKIKDAFSVEKVTEEFFEAYKYALRNVIIPELKNDNVIYDKKHSFAQQLLSRILFIYFLQRKGWFKWKNYVQDTNYIKNFWLKYKALLKQNKIKKDTFYSEWLCSLFFGAFNKKSNLISNNLPEEIKESLYLMPFLNGGLFSKNELDELNFNLPDSIFEWLFEPIELSSDKNKGFLETFNFTTNEASFDDADVAVDPEMLGKVYESLI